LVLDHRFPRSVAHCLDRAAERLARVRTPEADARGHSLRRLRELHGRVADDASDAIDSGRLHGLLTLVVDETQTVCDEIGRELLGHAPAGGAAAAAQ
ncbi:MAG TPA: alpha-E domain-containing protein, partial [Anaeromyxobacteraceae bacterium]|nr:alpha-E domain-containing protein [Anaeromyxobacteraceae bacterium]